MDLHDLNNIRWVMTTGIWVVITALAPAIIGSYGVTGHDLWLTCSLLGLGLLAVMIVVFARSPENVAEVNAVFDTTPLWVTALWAVPTIWLPMTSLVAALVIRRIRNLGGLRVRGNVVRGTAFQMRETRVPCDAEHPRHEVAVVLERRLVLQHLHEHVLHQILGRRAVARHPQAIPVDARVMALEQRREGRRAAAADLPHQFRVARFLHEMRSPCRVPG